MSNVDSRCRSVKWLTADVFRMCGMTYLFVWHDSFICVPWRIHLCDSFVCVIWPVHYDRSCLSNPHACVCWYVWHDSFMRVTWRIHLGDMPHSYVWHDLFMRVISLIHMWHVTQMDTSCHTHEWVMSHIYAHDITHSYVACHPNGYVMSHAWKSHVTHICAWYHSFICGMSPKWIRHVTRMNESCHTYMRMISLIHICDTTPPSWSEEPYKRDDILQKRPMILRSLSHIWMSHETCHTYEWVLQHDRGCLSNLHACVFWYAWHVSFICVTWRIHLCDMPHSYMWHDLFMRVTWLIHICDMTHPLWSELSQQSTRMCMWHVKCWQQM